jgi:hypothetical protein
MVIGAGPKNIKIRHNTVDNDGSGTLVFYKAQRRPAPHLRIRTHQQPASRQQVWHPRRRGAGFGTAAFNAFTPNGVVLRNAIGGADPSSTGRQRLPESYDVAADFVDRASADYR